jgi:hypothetical protein
MAQIKSVDKFGKKVSPVLLNICYGGFSLSEKTRERIKELFDEDDFDEDEIPRHNKELISLVSKQGLEKSVSKFCKLSIQYIPTEFLNFYCIKDNDGIEYIELDYFEYNNTKLCLILNNCELTPEQKIEEITKLHLHVNQIKDTWNCEMFRNP